MRTVAACQADAVDGAERAILAALDVDEDLLINCRVKFRRRLTKVIAELLVDVGREVAWRRGSMESDERQQAVGEQ